MSPRSQSLPPCPGPPPSIPPPPLPDVSPHYLGNSPSYSPHASKGQWPSRSRAQRIKEDVVWPQEFVRDTPSNVMSEDGSFVLRKPATRSASLPSPSTSDIQDPSEWMPGSRSPEPPVPPIRSLSHKRRGLEVRATVGHSRGVHRRTSSVRRRVSLTTGAKSSSLTPANRAATFRTPHRRPSRNPTSTSPVTPSPAPQSSENPLENQISCHTPALNKKRSFFKRVADHFTRSRGNLRDETPGSKAQVLLTATDPIISHTDDGDVAPQTLEPSHSSPLPSPTPSPRTRKGRPPSIKVPSYDTFVVIGDRPSFDLGVKSPSRIPLPSSPPYSSVYATTTCTSTTSSGFLSPSTIPTPTTPTQHGAGPPRIPRKSASSSALSELSRRTTASEGHPPLPSPYGLSFPSPSNSQLSMQGRVRSDDNLTRLAGHSRTNSSLRYAQKPSGFRSPTDFDHVGANSPSQVDQATRGCVSNDTIGEAVLQTLSPRNSESHWRFGGRESWQMEHQAGNPNFGGWEKPDKVKTALVVPRTDMHARADSHTLGNLLLDLPRPSSQTERTVYEDSHMNCAQPPPSSGQSLANRGGNETHTLQESTEDVQLANLKVNRWLDESSLAPAPTLSQQSHALSTSDSSYGRGTASFDTWRTIAETDIIDDDQLPPVKRLALRDGAQKGDNVERSHGKSDNRGKTARKRSLFGRKRELSDVAVTPSNERSLKETRRRSFRFLPARTADLPPSPALPSPMINHVSPKPATSSPVGTAREYTS